MALRPVLALAAGPARNLLTTMHRSSSANTPMTWHKAVRLQGLRQVPGEQAQEKTREIAQEERLVYSDNQVEEIFFALGTVP